MVTRQLQIKRRTGKVRRRKTYVLPVLRNRRGDTNEATESSMQDFRSVLLLITPVTAPQSSLQLQPAVRTCTLDSCIPIEGNTKRAVDISEMSARVAEDTNSDYLFAAKEIVFRCRQSGTVFV